MLFLRERSRRIHCLAFSPDGRFLASAAGRGRTVRLWDLAAGKRRAILRGHEERVSGLAFSPDGITLASIDWGSLRLWQLLPGCEPVVCREPSGTGYSRLGFAPDGQLLIATWRYYADYRARLRDLATGKEQILFIRHDPLPSLAFAPSGQMLAAGTLSKKVELWDLSTREARTTLPQRAVAYDLAFSPDARILAAAQGWSPSLWDLSEQREQAVLRGHKAPVWSMAFAPDSHLLASASADGTVRFWDTCSGKERAVFDWQIGRVRVAAFSPDGMRAAAGGDEGIVVWDVDVA